MAWLERLGTYWVILVRPFGALGASIGRFLCVLGCVFLHCYFGMYLLRGISTLDAPALPRTPLRASARLRVYLRAYVRLCALLGSISALLYRCGFATSCLCSLVRLFVRSLGFLCASGACLFCAPVRASFALWCTLLGTLLGTLLHGSLGVLPIGRRWRYHSFITLHSASYLFFLTHVHLKLSYINHIFSVYNKFIYT